MNFDIKEVKIEIYIPEEYIEEIRNALILQAHAGPVIMITFFLPEHERIWRPLRTVTVSRRKGTICLRY